MTKIIMPPEEQKKELTEVEKEAALRSEFRMDDDHALLEESKQVPLFPEEDRHLLESGGVEITEAPIVRGQMLGESQGMKPRRPLEKHAALTSSEAGQDDVPPMHRKA